MRTWFAPARCAVRRILPPEGLARKGREVERKPRAVTIYDLEKIGEENGDALLRVTCSKGTYIRALARDIGTALNSGGHLTALRRTRVGKARVEDCHTLEALIAHLEEESYVMPDQAEQMRLDAERIANKARAAAMKAKRKAALKASE